VLGFLDRFWSALTAIARIYALALYCYLGCWAAYSAYVSNSTAASTKGADGATEYSTPSREVRIPIGSDPGHAAAYKELRLYYTRDDGKTWLLGATAKPTDTSFLFTAPDDGLYGFGVQIETTDGRLNPPKTTALLLQYRIRFGAQSVAQKAPDSAHDDLSALRDRVTALEKRLEQAERAKAGREVELKELRERIEKLEKRLADLERPAP
jgi:hypothetical protein